MKERPRDGFKCGDQIQLLDPFKQLNMKADSRKNDHDQIEPEQKVQADPGQSADSVLLSLAQIMNSPLCGDLGQPSSPPRSVLILWSRVKVKPTDPTHPFSILSQISEVPGPKVTKAPGKYCSNIESLLLKKAEPDSEITCGWNVNSG